VTRRANFEKTSKHPAKIARVFSNVFGHSPSSNADQLLFLTLVINNMLFLICGGRTFDTLWKACCVIAGLNRKMREDARRWSCESRTKKNASPLQQEKS